MRERNIGPKLNQTFADEELPNQEQNLLWFSRKLVKLMAEHNECATDLAMELGISTNVTTRWLIGKSFPNLNSALLLAKHYGLGINELLEGMEV